MLNTGLGLASIISQITLVGMPLENWIFSELKDAFTLPEDERSKKKAL